MNHLSVIIVAVSLSGGSSYFLSILDSQRLESISAEVCGAVGLGLLGGSYMAESFRSELEAVPVLQMESALALGMNCLQMFRSVILPQAFSISVPAIVANIIFLLKETSVFSAISLISVVLSMAFGILLGMIK